MNKMIRRILGVAVLLGVGASLGSASTISYWVDVFNAITTAQQCVGPCPAGSTSTLGAGGGPDITLTIPKFDQTDPNPGHIFTLTNIAISLDWRATGTAIVDNFFSADIPFTSVQASTLMTLSADGTQVVANGIAGTGAGVAPCCNILRGTPIFLGETTFSNLSGSGSNSQNSLNFGFFQGFGSNSFTADLATDAVAVNGSSNDPHAKSLRYGGDGNMGAIATFTYSFAEVAAPAPEPLTFALVGSSLIGLGLVVRRKRAKKA
jgi:hypothetical protein